MGNRIQIKLGLYKKLKRISRRTTAFLLAWMMVLGMVLPVSPVYAAEGDSAASIVVSQYSTSSMCIYSYMHYQGTGGTTTVGGGSYELSGTKENFHIYIGAYNAENQSDNTISVKLNGLNLSDSQDASVSAAGITINKVKTGMPNSTVIMSVVGNSVLTNLNILPGATLTLNVEKDLTVENLYMMQDSKLTVSVAEGATCDITTLSGDTADTASLTAGVYTIGGEEDLVTLAAREKSVIVQAAAPEDISMAEAETSTVSEEVMTEEQPTETEEVNAGEAESLSVTENVTMSEETIAAEDTTGTEEQSVTEESTISEAEAEEADVMTILEEDVITEDLATEEAETETETAAEETETETEIAAQETETETETETAAQETETETATEEPETEAVTEESETIPSATEESAVIDQPEMNAFSLADMEAFAVEEGIYGDVIVTEGKGLLKIGIGKINSMSAVKANISIEKSLSCETTLNLDGTTISGGTADGNNPFVAAKDNITVKDSHIKAFKLFGYDNDVTGNKTLQFSGNTKIDAVDIIGTKADSQAIVTVTGIKEIVSIESSSVISDFPVTFYYKDELLTATDNRLSGFITHYRASYSDKNGTLSEILGTRDLNGYQSSQSSLPTFTQDGYTYNGWKKDNEGTAFYNFDGLLSTVTELCLYAGLNANGVTINWDLGFEPNEYNTDLPAEGTLLKNWTTAAETDQVISLPAIPFQMGYVFDGWTPGAGVVLSPDASEYTVKFTDLNQDSNNDTINDTLSMNAKWKPKTYQFRLSFSNSQVEDQYIEISFDHVNWFPLTDLRSAVLNADSVTLSEKITYSSKERSVSFANDISMVYDETMSQFFINIDSAYKLPLLRDNRDAATALKFAGWTTASNTVVESESVFRYGSGGILDNRITGQTLKDYDESLRTSLFVIQPKWGDMTFNLSASDTEGWDIFVGDSNTPLTTAEEMYTAQVAAGTTITLRTKVSNISNVSHWTVNSDDSERMYLTETPYVSGSQYMEYTFVMPKANVEAVYHPGDEEYFDLAKGAITLAEKVLYNSLERNGFWYDHKKEDMPAAYTPVFAKVGNEYKTIDEVQDIEADSYFYAWNSSNFYVTSNNVQTQNQLTLINTMNVYLKECNLIKTDRYAAEARGTKLGTKELNGASAGSFYQEGTDVYGNIVINNRIHNLYAVNLFVIGTNTVHGIFQSDINSVDAYKTTLTIQSSGSESILNLGCNLGNFITVLKNIQVNEVEDDFEYIFYSPNAKLQGVELKLINSKLIAQTKCVYIALGNFKLEGDSKADLGTVYIGYWIYIYNNSYVRIRGDYRGVYFGFDITGNGSAVVDGDMITTGTWYANNQNINTNGYLVIKGKYMNAGHITLKKGTLIANTIGADYKADITGGRIITNQLVNTPVSEGLEYNGYLATRNGESAVWDQIPFPTYRSQDNNTVYRNYKFGGGQIYLFGYYETDTEKRYDYLGKWDDEKNPMVPLIDSVIDPLTGDLKSGNEIEAALDHTSLVEAIATQAQKYIAAGEERECIALGNSNEDIGVDPRYDTEHTICGSAQIYAAGNLTFFNRTTIKEQATVVTHGTLRSHRDLLIEGSVHVTAAAIGNSSALYLREADGTYRWQALRLNGGTVITDCIGFNDQTRTTIIPGETVSVISPKSGSSIRVIRDTRVNYLFSESEFYLPSETPNYGNIRVNGKWENSGFAEMEATETTFASVCETDGTVARWRLGSLKGEEVTKVTSEGKLDNVSQNIAYEMMNASLYAVKDKYTLVIKDGIENLSSVKIGDEQVAIEDSIQVGGGSTVTMSFVNPDWAYKTVVWYWDANGLLHNVNPVQDSANGTFIFEMPNAAAEVYITNEIELDLYRYPVTLTDEGFVAAEVSDETISTIRSDAKFVYHGDIRITQSNIESIKVQSSQIGLPGSSYGQIAAQRKTGYTTAYTVHGISVIADPAGFERTVTLEKIYQSRNPKTYGIFAYAGADLEFKVSGVIRIDAIGSETTETTVNISGTHDNKITKETTKNDILEMDVLFLDSWQKSYDSGCIEVSTINISNLVLLKCNSGHMFGKNNRASEVTLRNVYTSLTSYNGPVMCNILTSLDVMDSAIDGTTATSNAGLLFSGVGTATFNNSRVNYIYGGEVTSSSPIGKANSLTLIDTQWEAQKRPSDGSKSNWENPASNANVPGIIIMKGSSSIRSDYRLQLFKVEMEGTSAIEVYETADCVSDSYFLCKDITMQDGAKITADYVIVSGFVENAPSGQSTYSTFVEWMKQGLYLQNNGRLTMTGGTIAAEKALGGAYSAEINISGGTVTAPAIGTLESAFGYTGVMPTKDEQFVYMYALTPSDLSSTVHISGDAKVCIQSGGYLGGHNSTINIAGGTVTLENGAVIGLTDEQRTNAENDATLNGKVPANEIKVSVAVTGGTVEGAEAAIKVPYGEINISGSDTAVKVKNLIADLGSIKISNAANRYPLPDGYMNDSKKVGVYVCDTMSAMDIKILNQAMVYACTATAVIPGGKTGGLVVTSNQSDTRLYVESYGVSGDGAAEDSLQVQTGGDNQNLYSKKKIVQVSYHLCDDKLDPAENSDQNPAAYTQGTSSTIKLEPAARRGYIFDGWYMDAEYTRKIEALDLSNGNPVNLYAKWILRKIEVEVFVDKTAEGISSADLAEEAANVCTPDGDTYKYKKIFSIPYRAGITGLQGINLAELALKTYGVEAIRVATDTYAGNTYIGSDTILGPEHLKAADEAATKRLRLKVSAVNKKLVDIIFDLNLDNNLPYDAQFSVGPEETDNHTDDTRQSLVSYDKKIGDGKGFVKNDVFIFAFADGYEFKGWSNNRNASADQEYSKDLRDTDINVSVPTAYYAVWKPRTYQVEFKAEGGMITETNKKPTGNESASYTKVVTYDESLGELPFAWKKGYVFKGWEVNGEAVSSEDLLRTRTFGTSLDVTKYIENGKDPVTALTITAVFDKVTVTYDLMGGKWTDNDMLNTDTPEYDAPLRGYSSMDTSSATSDYTVLGIDGTFGVISTTSEYYQAHKNLENDTGYVAQDYRKVLYRKGYTFAGWYPSADAGTAASAVHSSAYIGAVGTTPEYEDITLYAAWQPNVYNLKLYAYDENQEYKYTDFHYIYDGGEPPVATVTVGQLIAENASGENVNTIKWPERGTQNSWYAYDKLSDTEQLADTEKRFLLGFTFAALDPGSRKLPGGEDTYKEYAVQVTKLNNEKLLFQEGKSDFVIPETFDYADEHSVADYPDGSTIDMYAVYRERSLVFIESYEDADGRHEREMEAVPYSEYSEYPYDKTKGYKAPEEITGKGYKLLDNWYYFEPKVESSLIYPHDKTIYDQKLQTLVGMATTHKTYDIPVYTVYVAQASDEAVLKANGSNFNTEAVDRYDYTVPSSMQSGLITYEILENTHDLKLVAKNSLNVYDPSIADNTVAIVWKLLRPDAEGFTEVASGDLTETTAAVSMSELEISAGWIIRLELYTSKVVTTNKDYELKIKFGFKSLPEQWVQLAPLTIDMEPNVYTVTYDANLPEDPNLLVDYKEYSTKDGKWTQSVKYGSALTNRVPKVEGYTVSGNWIQTDSEGIDRVPEVSAAFNDPLKVSVSSSDKAKLYFRTDWTINSYPLQISAEVMEYWDVSYTPLNGTEVKFTEVQEVNEAIPYHSTVVFSPKENADSPKFVEITQKEIKTLDEYENYTLTMGTEGITAKRKTIRDLYLEKGTIHITPDGYVQDGVTDGKVEWPGGYTIWMDENNNTDGSETPNVLNLSGDLSEKAINLGDLKIASADSIALKQNTKAVLTMYSAEKESTVAGKNVLVPQGADLTIKQGTLELTPDVSKTAVGSSEGSTAVTLNGVDVAMTLPLASSASGIGAEKIAVAEGMITVTQQADPSDHYRGTWIGGANADTVTLTDVTVKQGNGSQNYSSAYAVKADSIELNRSSLGTTDNGISTPVYAHDTLTVKNSVIYQELDGKIADVPVGAGREIHVADSEIQTKKNNGSWDNEATTLYKGTMKIHDAESKVIIANTMILELQNGDVTIDSSKVNQASQEKTFSGNYLLLEELLDSAAKPDVTVNAIQGNVTVQHPVSDNSFVLDTLTIHADTSLKLTQNTNLSVNAGKIDALLEVDSTKNGTVTLAKDAVKSAAGTYAQTGGMLVSAEEIRGEALDVILNQVTVNADSLIAENLTLTDSTVTCTNGQVGSMGLADGITTVTLAGTTAITADTVGALGKQNDTFTFVKVEGNQVEVSNALVQDHYRIAYDVLPADAPAYTVFRSTQNGISGEQSPVESSGTANDGVPGKPKNMPNFAVWYYVKDGKYYAVSVDTVPGYTESNPLNSSLLAYAEPETEDGTRTLNLYSGIDIDISISMKEGRLFTGFTSNTTSVTVPANSAWTAQIAVKGTVVENSGYQLEFAEKLPIGTKLTLTVLEDERSAAYYFYIVDSTATKTVKLSDFKAMGEMYAADIPDFTRVGESCTQTLLLAADFIDADAAGSDNSFTFRYLIDNEKQAEQTAQYTLSDVDGAVSATTEKVTAAFPKNSVYTGQSMALVAALSGDGISYTASMKVEDIAGERIDGTRFVFPISTDGAKNYTISGCTGDFTVTWSLVVWDEGIVDEVALDSNPIAFNVNPTEPYLSVTDISIDGVLTSIRTLPQGEAHTLVLNYETNAAAVMVEGQKQNNILCTFEKDSQITVNAVQPNNGTGTITLTLPASLEAGVYRICISMKDGCADDDVYLSYVVMP